MPLPLIPIAVAGGALLATTIAGFKGKEAYDNYKKSGELVIARQKAIIKQKMR
ncbi:hypothetical protein [Helicobacter ganmani]|uniref:hypothetical protein n=1 Tax=Helicobacter ganmani TaxID=60246 RepID=UPI0025AF47F2|nr:hypothetical protein [uncultured Muribaculum sp.]